MEDVCKDPAKALLKKAKKHINKFEYDVALQFCERALSLQPEYVQALELSASLLQEPSCLDLDRAKSRLQRAVELSPDDGYTKFFSLAQMCEGQEALDYYTHGIAMLETKLEQTVGGDQKAARDERALMSRVLSTAYCSVSELFTTDLCMEENAETQCSENIEKAIQVDPGNPEAHQARANFLLIKGEHEEARSAMMTSLSFWLPKMNELLLFNSETNDPLQDFPLSFETRVSAAKILIELEEYDFASEVLEGLLTEDDEAVEVWYLAGFMNYNRGEDFQGNARYYLNKVKKLAAKTGDADPEVLQHMEEMLNDIGPGSEGDEDDAKSEDVPSSDSDEEMTSSDDYDDDKENT